MVFVKAGPAEILRSTQKDEISINKLQRLFEDVFLHVLGPRRMIKYKAAVQNAGQLLYFANTTLCGLQTLGEEYTGILQVNDSFQSIPSLLSRTVMVLLHCFGSQVVKSFISDLEKNVQQNCDLKPENKEMVLFSIRFMKFFIPSIELLHKAVFFCNWGTYHISKRITGVHYVLIRYWLRDKKSLFGFRILGIITLINFWLHSLQSLSECLKNDIEETEEEESHIDSEIGVGATKCAMCLNKMRNPTATMCGHIYCWSCITEWVQNQDRCPICRETVLQSRLVPLHNYS